jgi:hypothetical protein
MSCVNEQGTTEQQQQQQTQHDQRDKKTVLDEIARATGA